MRQDYRIENHDDPVDSVLVLPAETDAPGESFDGIRGMGNGIKIIL